jgi:hypothetical protein
MTERADCVRGPLTEDLAECVKFDVSAIKLFSGEEKIA